MVSNKVIRDQPGLSFLAGTGTGPAFELIKRTEINRDRDLYQYKWPGLDELGPDWNQEQ